MKTPVLSEHGKRIIGGNPFTFSSPLNKWVWDKAPPTGLAAAPPVSNASIAPKTKVPLVIKATEEQPSDDITTASTVAQLQVQMAALQRKLASVQDSMG